MEYDGPIRFGDKVRVCDTAATRELGFGGLIGHVLGETTPSVTGVDVIGTPRTDFALNVHFDECEKGAWFAADLLEFIDHAPGTEIEVGSEKFMREPDGQWRHVVTNLPESRAVERPWWRFW